jgi:hypothetical protein
MTCVVAASAPASRSINGATHGRGSSPHPHSSGGGQPCGRVERWRGGWEETLALVAGPFGNQLPVSFRQPRFHLPLVEPDRRISRIRLSDGIREAAHETARYRFFTAVARSFRRSESLIGGYRQHGHSPDSSHFQTAPEVRPLSSTGVTRLRRYYEPVRHPTRPGLSLAGVRLVLAEPPLGFPVFRISPVACVPSPLPRWDRWVRASFATPATLAFPEIMTGRLPH